MTSDSDAAAGTWTARDAWLLLSIGDHGRSGCGLSRIIGSADARNHDIPTEAECASILGTLIASGLVDREGDRYRVTSTGRRIAKSASGEFFLQPGTLLPALAKIPRVEDNFNFRDGEFHDAYQEYRRRAMF